MTDLLRRTTTRAAYTAATVELAKPVMHELSGITRRMRDGDLIWNVTPPRDAAEPAVDRHAYVAVDGSVEWLIERLGLIHQVILTMYHEGEAVARADGQVGFGVAASLQRLFEAVERNHSTESRTIPRARATIDLAVRREQITADLERQSGIGG